MEAYSVFVLWDGVMEMCWKNEHDNDMILTEQIRDSGRGYGSEYLRF